MMNKLLRRKRATSIYLWTSFDGIRFLDQRFHVNNINNNNYNVWQVSVIHCI